MQCGDYSGIHEPPSTSSTLVLLPDTVAHTQEFSRRLLDNLKPHAELDAANLCSSHSQPSIVQILCCNMLVITSVAGSTSHYIHQVGVQYARLLRGAL